MKPFCSYQGSKSKYAQQIVDIINPEKGEVIGDFCCGSGTVSLELIKRGCCSLYGGFRHVGRILERHFRRRTIPFLFLPIGFSTRRQIVGTEISN